MIRNPFTSVRSVSARGFFRDHRGAAIVEFALVVPVLLVVLAGISDGAAMVMKQNAMHTGVSSAAQYIMSGGSDLATAQKIGLSSWPSHSSSASVTASKACYCASVAGDCSTLCSDQTVPQATITVAATDSYHGWYITTSISTQQQVRVR